MSEMAFTGLKPVFAGQYPSRGCGRASVSLPFPAPRSHLYPLTRGPFLHLQSTFTPLSYSDFRVPPATFWDPVSLLEPPE